MFTSRKLLTALALWVPVSAYGASTLPPSFQLGRYIPDDVWLYMDFAENPEAAWMGEQWDEVLEALKKSGVDRDLMSLLAMSISDDDYKSAEATVENLLGLCRGVGWSEMVGKETAFAMRLSTLPVPYDYFLMTRGDEGTGEKNFQAILALLGELTSWSERVSLNEKTVPGLDVWMVALPEKVNTNAYVFRKGDTIGFVFGNEGFDDVLSLLQGKDGVKPIVADARFKKALDEVPNPEDGVIFFHASRFFNDLGEFMDQMVQFKAKRQAMHEGHDHDDHAEQEKQQHAPIMKAIHKAIHMWDFAEYSITSISTEGRQQMTNEVTRLRPETRDGKMCKIFVDRQPFDRFDQYIPADATNFSISAFVDLKGLYDLAIDFVREDLPDGASLIQQWDATLNGFGLNLHRDVFSWWSGEMVSITMPAAVVTPMGGADSVFMIRVKNEELARQKVNTVVNWGNAILQEYGQPLMLSPANVSKEGFQQIVHPMLAMFLRPVIGVADGWLFVGTSADAINKCLSVAAGDSPSIMTNERFKLEGLLPDGPVHTLSFTDTSKFGQELASAMGMIGMIGGFATANIPDPDAKKVVQTIFGAAMKLGPVFQKIDFYSSQATRITVDGNIVRTDTVITYKPEEKAEPKTAKASSDSQ